jgi:adenylosuccinate lyase
MPNLMMPGSPRYQPRGLIEHFGYDNTYRGLACVEFANLKVLGELGVIPCSAMSFLTPELEAAIMAIPATDVDKTEKEVTGHDVRAWIHEAQKLMLPELGRWMHILLTSYDALDTGRILQYTAAHQQVVAPKTRQVIGIMADLVEKFADQVQIGRTHGQHALPITVGFWLATILARIHYNYEQMEISAANLRGKISGAVGAYNAQDGLGISQLCEGGPSYEERVLARVGLKPPPISTQILPPEPLAYYLHACTQEAIAFGQFGDDGRNLMRTEIAEIAEARWEGQVGSSTMTGKINPIKFEGLKGDSMIAEVLYHLVLRTGISEHQRDLTGSRPARKFPEIVITLVNQLGELLRAKGDEEPFLARIVVKPENCKDNFDRSSHTILGEPLYIALQMAGYNGDAHALINDEIAPRSRVSGRDLLAELIEFAEDREDLQEVLAKVPAEMQELFHNH